MNNSGINMNYGVSMGSYKTTIIEEITGSTTGSTGSTDVWTPPVGWIDISTVGDNEINLLVTDDSGIGFKVKIGNGSASNTFSVDWGDGVIENGIAGNNIISQHKHTTGGTICAEGYPVWKVRIFNASTNITQFAVAKHTYIGQVQESPILWAVLGTTKLTTYANAFYGSGIVSCSKLRALFFPDTINGATSLDYICYQCVSLTYIKFPTESLGTITTGNYAFYQCTSLKKVILPTSWGSMSSLFQFFGNCSSLQNVTLPTTWGSVTSVSNMFGSCFTLENITLPSSWGSINNFASMFYNTSLRNIVLPTTWGNGLGIQCNNMFDSCKCLTAINLPVSWGNVTNIANMFVWCSSLKVISLPSSWGDVSLLMGFLAYCKSLTNITIPAAYNNNSTSWIGFVNDSSSLRTINNLEYAGSLTTASSFSNILYNCASLDQPIVINAKLTRIGISGGAYALLKVNSVRLTNAASDFSGASPQIDVSYTSMDATALNTLFGDLPTLSGKVITVKGCPGSATCDTSIATAKGWSVTTA